MPRRNRRSRAAKEQWKFRGEALLKESILVNGKETALSSDCMFCDQTNGISVRASYSQSDDRFSEYSRGSQCVANSLMCLAHLHESDQMVREKLDYVLQKGDQFYCQIRQRLEASNRFVSRHLNFEDVPDSIETDRGSYNVILFNQMNGLLLQDAPEGWENYLNLSLGLESLGTEYLQALLFVGALCIAVFQDRHARYGFFDPHSRNANGTCYEENGNAVMVTFHSVTDLTKHLLQLLCESLQIDANEQYHILPVCFESTTSEELNMGLTSVRTEKDNVEHHTSDLPKVSMKLSKIRRKRVLNRIRRLALQRNQQSLNEKQIDKDLETAQRKRDAKAERYRLHAPQLRAAMRARYRNDMAFRWRHKQYIKEAYRNDPVFRQRQKQRSRDSYRARKLENVTRMTLSSD